MTLFIGCAGWNLRKDQFAEFPLAGTHLQRYASRLNCVEINSSFYRPHRRSSYQRWAASTPSSFRFAVKAPKQITHIDRLVNSESRIEQFSQEVSGLGEKLGPILVQLPPSLAFDCACCERFFCELRTRFTGPIVCEPRHISWFGPEAEALLRTFLIARVAADPALTPLAAVPEGCRHHCYFRWHGSPRMYYSSYGEESLETLARQTMAVLPDAQSVWCLFDNTAEGAALRNALTLGERLAAATMTGVCT